MIKTNRYRIAAIIIVRVISIIILIRISKPNQNQNYSDTIIYIIGIESIVIIIIKNINIIINIFTIPYL